MKVGDIVEVKKVICEVVDAKTIKCSECLFYTFQKGFCTSINCDKYKYIGVYDKLFEKIEQLEKQIEEMKVCENCDNFKECDEMWGRKHIDCKNFSEWELKNDNR